MRFAIIFLSFGVVTWASASQADDGPALPSDQDRLQGSWVCYPLSLGTEPPPKPAETPPKPSDTFPLQISGNHVKLVEKGTKNKDAVKELSFTIDPTQNPKTVEIQWLEDNKKITWKGIYALENDEVRVALLVKSNGIWLERGSERPTSFTGKPPKDCGILVLVLRRAKGPQAAAENDETEQPPRSIAFNGFGAVALSPDGKWIAASGTPGTTVRLWDVATGKEIAVLPGHESEVMTVVFSQDGKRLFTATPTEVRTWELPKGKQMQRIPAGPGWKPDQFTLSGDDRWFVSDPDLKQEITSDGKCVIARIRLWDVEKGREVRSFKIVRTTVELVGQYIDFFAQGKGSDAIIATALSHDGKWVAAGTEHGDVHLWEAKTGTKVRTFGRSKDIGAIPVGFSKDGKWLVTSVFRWTTHGKPDLRASVLLWDVATGEAKHEIQGNMFLRSLTEDGKWLITGQDEKTVRIWDVETGKEVGSFTERNDPVVDCFISRDKKLLATSDQSGTVRLWEIATGKELRAIKARTPADRGWPRANFKVRVNSDAKLLVAWTPSRLTLWNLESGKPIRSVERKVDD
jgi:uncharacterized protein (TIGR03067 family)